MILLNNEKLSDIFERLNKNIKDQEAIENLLAVLKPVLSLTLEKFHQQQNDDLKQDIILSVLKKLDYLTKGFITGRILDPTSYFFRMFRNSALIHLQKEIKQAERMCSIEDIKVEAVIERRTLMKSRVLLRVRDEVTEWLRYRFPDEKDYRRASKYVDVILSGKRPSFKTRNITKWYSARQVPAKDAYSIVLQRIRESIINNAEDFGLHA